MEHLVASIVEAADVVVVNVVHFRKDGFDGQFVLVHQLAERLLDNRVNVHNELVSSSVRGVLHEPHLLENLRDEIEAPQDPFRALGLLRHTVRNILDIDRILPEVEKGLDELRDDNAEVRVVVNLQDRHVVCGRTLQFQVGSHRQNDIPNTVRADPNKLLVLKLGADAKRCEDIKEIIEAPLVIAFAPHKLLYRDLILF